MIIRYTIDTIYANKSLAFLLTDYYKMSKRFITKLKYQNKIKRNNLPIKINDILLFDDLIEIDLILDDDIPSISINNHPIEILFEDEHFIALSKPKDTCTHPTFQHPENTLANHLLAYIDKKGEPSKIRPLSRLDRNTTGIVLFAKNAYVQSIFNTCNPLKKYRLLVYNKFEEIEGEIIAPIKRKTLIEREISLDGQYSKTSYKVLKQSNTAAYVEAILHTGRTHQLRLHFSHIGHPLIGETLYSDKTTNDIIDRQALHSYELSFVHPLTNKIIIINAPLPDDIKKAGDFLIPDFS